MSHSIDENKLAFELGKWSYKIDCMFYTIKKIIEEIDENPVLCEKSIQDLRSLESQLFDFPLLLEVDDFFPKIFEKYHE